MTDKPLSGNYPWLESLQSKYGADFLKLRESAPEEIEIFVKAARAMELLGELKTLSSGAFEHLADLTGYDDVPGTPRFHMVYELISMTQKKRMRVVVPLEDDAAPRIPTATNLWKGAGWLEREVYDLLGVEFVGHNDQRRIYLPDSFKGHPLRKDFIVDYRQSFPYEKEDGAVFDPFGNTIVTPQDSGE